jgi:hypothetical protein
VVHGRVAAVSSRAVAGGRRIVSDVDVAVESVWKGAAPATVRVVVPGGRVGDVAMAVDAVPAFAPGEEVVLFLSRRGPVYGLAGLGLGKYAVRGAEARPSLGPEGALPRALPAGERAAGPVTLAELERRVRAVQ